MNGVTSIAYLLSGVLFIRSLGGQVASAAEARQMLNLPAGGAR